MMPPDYGICIKYFETSILGEICCHTFPVRVETKISHVVNRFVENFIEEFKSNIVNDKYLLDRSMGLD